MKTLHEQIDAIRWYHRIDLGGGLITPGVDNSSLRLEQLKLPKSLVGLSVLDVGAWDGFFSFEAERRGASQVVALDSYSWTGAGWGTKEGFELARRALGSQVQDVELDVLDLSPERVGLFDVVLCLGVLYHMRHPILALERVASVTKRLLILETVVDCVGYTRPMAAFYPNGELNGDPTNWWGPNPQAVAGMLRTVGFTNTIMVSPRRLSASYRAARAVWHWVQQKNSLAAAFRQDRAVFHASVDR
jgi:tRNA (mo5U34)-methyltransferase